MIERVLGSIKEWARGRTWWTRVPVVLASAWLGVTLVADCDTWTIFGAIDLGIHEAGQDEALVRQFASEVDTAYQAILTALQQADADLPTLARQYQQVQARDYFHSSLGQQVRAALLQARGGDQQ